MSSSAPLLGFALGAVACGRKLVRGKNTMQASRRDVLSAAVLWSSSAKAASAAGAPTAPEVVRNLWGNGLTSEEDLGKWVAAFSDDCVYEDLYFEDPARGHKQLKKTLRQKLLPQGSRLVLDHISDGRMSCGFTWHIQEDGVGTGQRGLCFVRLNDKGEVAYVRDVGEPLFKAGELTEKLLQALTKDQPRQVQPPPTAPQTPRTASGIVRYLYGDVQQSGGDAVRFFADDAVYEDMNYDVPFIGQKEVEGFLQRFQGIEGVTFVLEEVSDGDKAVGFTYHIDVAGQPGAVKGITYYEVNEKGKVVYVRDVPESPTKPPPIQQVARLLRPGLRRLQPATPLPGDIGAA